MAKILSWLGALAAPLAVLSLLLLMNGIGKNDKEVRDYKSTFFRVKKITPPPKVKLPPKKTVVKKIKHDALLPPALGNLAGQSFGLEHFEFLADAGKGLLSIKSNAIMNEETVDDPPKARYRPPLLYPKSAREKSIEGHVILNLLVGTEGQVERVRLLTSTPQGIFDQVAMDSVRKWQFDAAKYQGKRVKVWVKQRISFNLN